jgi:broad specificity phosphatase PhoE
VLAEITPAGRRLAQAAAAALAGAAFGLDRLDADDLRRVHDAITPLLRAAGDFE